MPKSEWVHEREPVFTAWFTSGAHWSTTEPVGTSYRDLDYLKGNITISQGNPGWRNLGGEAVGGDFQVYKKDFRCGGFASGDRMHFSDDEDPMGGTTEHWFTNQYAAVINVDQASRGWREIEATGMSELDALGATAISRCIPTNPIFNLSTALGEAREGFPRLGLNTWQDRAFQARRAGDDYLNYEFGWKPLVGEIETFFNMVKNSDRILKQYEAGSGKRLHARYAFPDEVEYDVYEEWGRLPVPTLIDATDLGNSPGRFTATTTTKTKRWFEGVFTYHLPAAGTLDGYLARANKLAGVRLTPETLWELAPWSWAADWFSNSGDVISNVSRFMEDGLVMPYGYIMETKTIEVSCDLRHISYFCYPGDHHFNQTWTTSVKTRRKATPFGFGFDWDGLTPRQGAIMSALGLKR